jgi:clan AA aspartic protease (TIGR02281 family)
MVNQLIQVIALCALLALGVTLANQFLLQPPEPEVRAATNQGAATADRAASENGGQVGPQEVVLTRDLSGAGYAVKAEVNGATIDFLINLKIKTTRLSKADARRAGFDPDELEYRKGSVFARGKRVPEAPVTLGEVRVGPLVAHNVRAFVDKTGRFASISGPNLLDKLGDYEVQGKDLVIRN